MWYYNINIFNKIQKMYNIPKNWTDKAINFSKEYCNNWLLDYKKYLEDIRNNATKDCNSILSKDEQIKNEIIELYNLTKSDFEKSTLNQWEIPQKLAFTTLEEVDWMEEGELKNFIIECLVENNKKLHKNSDDYKYNPNREIGSYTLDISTVLSEKLAKKWCYIKIEERTRNKMYISYLIW